METEKPKEEELKNDIIEGLEKNVNMSRRWKTFTDTESF